MAEWSTLAIMLFMVIERFKDGNPRPVGERFRHSGRIRPDGLVYRASWVDSTVARRFQVMEAPQPELLNLWVRHWQDLVGFEVVPVLTSNDFWSKITPDNASKSDRELRHFGRIVQGTTVAITIGDDNVAGVHRYTSACADGSYFARAAVLTREMRAAFSKPKVWGGVRRTHSTPISAVMILCGWFSRKEYYRKARFRWSILGAQHGRIVCKQ